MSKDSHVISRMRAITISREYGSGGGGIDLKTARSRVQLKEKDRHRYLQAQYRRNPDDSHLYDLVVNTGVLSLDSAVALIEIELGRL